MNGVLSGTIQCLREYEFELRSILFPPQPDDPSDDNLQNKSLRYGETLDVKYCHLRHGIPEIEKQLFDSLQVTMTTTRRRTTTTSSTSTTLFFEGYRDSSHDHHRSDHNNNSKDSHSNHPIRTNKRHNKGYYKHVKEEPYVLLTLTNSKGEEKMKKKFIYHTPPQLAESKSIRIKKMNRINCS